MKSHLYSSICFICLFIPGVLSAQITIIDTLTDIQLVQKLTGKGVTISNITSSCDDSARAYFKAPNSNIGLKEGVVLTSGLARLVVGPNDNSGATGYANTFGDPDLDTLISGYTNDACIFEFDVEITSDSLSFQYVFGSEEYTEYVNSVYNDVFAFFISGPGIVGSPNIALVPSTTIPVAINNLNNGPANTGPCVNCAYYVDNGDGWTAPTNTDSTVTQYDAFTSVLTAGIGNLIPCQTYHLKISIADVGDQILDSGVFLKARSVSSQRVRLQAVTTAGPLFNTTVENCNVDGSFHFKMDDPMNVPYTVHFQIGGNATNGTDYPAIPDSVIIPAGDTMVTLNINPIMDGLTEPKESVIIYLINSCNNMPFDSAVLYIEDDFDIQAYGGNDTVCEFTSVQLYATPALSYTWTPAATLDNANNQNPLASPTQTTSYVVMGTMGTCIVFDSAIAVVSNEVLTLDAGSDDSICLNGSHQIDLVVNGNIGPFSYIWSPSTGLDNDSIQDPLSAAIVTTTYQVEVHSATGCRRTDSITVIVSDVPVPSVSIDASPTTLCGGDTIILFSNITPGICGPNPVGCTGPSQTATIANGSSGIGPTPYMGYWHDSRAQFLYLASELNSVGITSTSITELAFNISTKASTIPYDNFTIKMGCTNFAEVDSFIPNLSIVSLPKTINTTLGLNNHVLDIPYNWDGTSNLIVEICFDNAQYTLSDMVVTSATTYNSSVQKYTDWSVGCNLITYPYLFTTKPDISFTFCNTDFSSLQYQWLPSGNIISQTIDTAIAVVTSQSEFHLIIDDGYCTNMASVSIDLDSSFSVYAGEDTLACENMQVALNATLDGINPNDVSFNWSPAVQFNNPTIQSPIVSTLAQTSNYIIEVIASSGCRAYDTIQIQIDIPYTLATSNDTIMCHLDSIKLDANISGQNTNGFNFQWASSSGIVDPQSQNTIGVTNSNTNLFELSVTSPIGCVRQDSIWAVLDSSFSVSIGNDTVVCANESVLLNAIINGRNDQDFSFSWNPAIELNDPSIQTPIASPVPPFSTYVVEAISDAGCTSFDTINVQIDLPYQVDAGSDTIVCESENVALMADIIGQNPADFSFSWNLAAELSNPGIADPISSPTPPSSIYIIESTSAVGCNEKDTVIIVIDSIYQVDLGNDIYICNLQPIQLDANIDGRADAKISFQWKPASTLNNPTIQNPMAFPNGNAEYTVECTSANGCIERDSITVVLSEIDVSAWFYDTTIYVGDAIDLGANTNGPGPYVYEWTPSSQASDPDELITSISPSGDQLFILTITNAFGANCVDTTSIMVHVLERLVEPIDSAFAIPNAFTPNGDGLNDRIYPLMSGDINVLSFQVYNRWGVKVHDGAFPWDGTYKNTLQPTGVFVYVTEVRFPSHKHRKFQGSVTLLR